MIGTLLAMSYADRREPGDNKKEAIMNRMVKYQPHATSYWGLDTPLFGGSLLSNFFSDFFDRSRSWQDMAGYSKTDEGYEIKIPLPGISKDKIAVDLQNDILSIRAETENQNVVRSWSIPRNTDLEKIEATFQDGLLVIKIPQIQPETIKIEVK